MEIVEVLPALHMIHLEFGTAYLWHDEEGLALIDTGIAAMDVSTMVFGHGDPVVGGASAVLRAAAEQHVEG